MEHIPWTTTPVEQQHGSMAVLHRQHKTLAGAMLATRAFLHAARPLVDHVPADRAIAKREARIENLKRKNPSKASGYHMFVAEMMELTRRKAGTGTLSAAASRRVVCDCPWRWKSLSMAQQDEYEAGAADRARKKHRELEDDVQHAIDDLDLWHYRYVTELDAFGRPVPRRVRQADRR